MTQLAKDLGIELRPFCVHTEDFTEQEIADILDRSVYLGAQAEEAYTESVTCHKFPNKGYDYGKYTYTGVDGDLVTWVEDSPQYYGNNLLSREEALAYLHLEAKEGRLVVKEREVDNEGFIKWNGGEMPVPKGTIVHAKYRDGEESIVTAGLWHREEGYWELEDKNVAARWNHEGNCQDIIAYKLYKEEETTTPTSVIKGVEVDGEIEDVLYAVMAILHDDYELKYESNGRYVDNYVSLPDLRVNLDVLEVVKVTDIEKEKLDKEIEEVENKLNELKSKRGEIG